MSNFKSAFEKGRAASLRADAARAEAEAVVSEFGRQLRDASNSKLTVYLGETWIERSRKIALEIASAAAGVPKSEGGKKANGVFAMIRVGRTSGPAEMLCRLTFGPDTYPIELQWETEVHICNDKSGLTHGLECLAEDPRIGKKFGRLIDSYDALAASDAERVAAANIKAIPQTGSDAKIEAAETPADE